MGHHQGASRGVVGSLRRLRVLLKRPLLHRLLLLFFSPRLLCLVPLLPLPGRLFLLSSLFRRLSPPFFL